MTRSLVLALSLAFSSALFAQANDPLRYISGTTPAVGPSPWVTSSGGGWTVFHGFDAHVTYVSQTGPEEQENEVFSTNWFGLGVHRNFDRGFVLARGRVSLEPYTIEGSYPQIFQYVSHEGSDTPLIDRMRPNDLFGELAVHAGWRPTRNTLLHLYAAAVGDPALGAAPSQMRASGIDFAEAPFGWDIEETTHDSSSVVTAGLATRWISLEASIFHDRVTPGDHTDLEFDGPESTSARVTLTPTQNFALQVSRGNVGEDFNQRTITSASISYGGPAVAVTTLWTRREYDLEGTSLDPLPETAYGFEIALRGTRNTFMARAEHVDRPQNFPLQPFGAGRQEATHFTAGYILDLVTGRSYRAGIGVNIDYRTQTHDLEELYGHKPQGIYTFVRFRTGG
jgi:hypothetical protein